MKNKTKQILATIFLPWGTIIGVLLLIFVLAVACDSKTSASEPAKPTPVWDARYEPIHRYEDPEYGVVCYTFNYHVLSCVRVKP